MVSASIEAEFELSKQKARLPVDATLIRPLLNDGNNDAHGFAEEGSLLRETATTTSPDRTTLAEAYERYMDDPTRSWSASTRQAYETTRTVALALFGSDTFIKEISRVQVREFIDVLRFLPKNTVKLFPHLTLREAAERTQSDGSISRITAAHANTYLGNLSTFLNWAVIEEIIDRNPARGLRLPDEVARRDKRHPFSSRQLEQIFHAPIYTGCVNGEQGWASAGDVCPQNARYWVPLIALHTGMRLNEICQLDVADIRFTDSWPCIHITSSSLVGSNDKVLKTGISERVIPVHQTLLELGLIHFVERKERCGDTKLFDDIATGSRGVRAVSFSKWFTRFLRATGAHRERTSFHSFRHNFRDEMRIARIDHELAMALGGWTGNRSSASAASESYGYGFDITTLNRAIQQLRFGNIDLSHLMR